MKVIEYIGRVFMEMLDNTRMTDSEYLRMYQRCFEGTPDEVERKLAAWDYTHEITRPRRSSYGFI